MATTATDIESAKVSKGKPGYAKSAEAIAAAEEVLAHSGDVQTEILSGIAALKTRATTAEKENEALKRHADKVEAELRELQRRVASQGSETLKTLEVLGGASSTDNSAAKLVDESQTLQEPSVSCAESVEVVLEDGTNLHISRATPVATRVFASPAGGSSNHHKAEKPLSRSPARPPSIKTSKETPGSVAHKKVRIQRLFDADDLSLTPIGSPTGGDNASNRLLVALKHDVAAKRTSILRGLLDVGGGELGDLSPIPKTSNPLLDESDDASPNNGKATEALEISEELFPVGSRRVLAAELELERARKEIKIAHEMVALARENAMRADAQRALAETTATAAEAKAKAANDAEAAAKAQIKVADDARQAAEKERLRIENEAVAADTAHRLALNTEKANLARTEALRAEAQAAAHAAAKRAHDEALARAAAVQREATARAEADRVKAQVAAAEAAKRVAAQAAAAKATDPVTRALNRLGLSRG